MIVIGRSLAKIIKLESKINPGRLTKRFLKKPYKPGISDVNLPKILF